MVTANETQSFTARDSSYSDYMALPHLDKNINMPCFPPYNYASDLPSFNTGQQDAVVGLCKPGPPYCNISIPTGNLNLKESEFALSHGLGIIDKPVGASFSPQRRFLIFDQSENHTRLFFSPSLSSKEQILSSKTPANDNANANENASLIVEEKWDENHLSDGEGEKLDDSEEINALLYSDSDDGYEDDDGEDDEVTSKVQSSYNGDGSIDEVTEEVVANCDEYPKRQRLLDGKYKKSSPFLESGLSINRAADSSSYVDDVESSCAGVEGIGSNKVKIRQALKMLERIIPGLDNKDPLSIIDSAVAYLKSMKTEVETQLPLPLPLPHPTQPNFSDY